jgi:flagellar basal-body rod protein FlgB
MLLDRAFGIHEQALHLKSQRLEVLSQNIANADTPHYKARDLDFRAVLSKANTEQSTLRATHEQHFRIGAGPHADGLRFRMPLNTSFDGNTVELSVEQAQYGQAAADYQATLSFLEQRVSGLRKALRGD